MGTDGHDVARRASQHFLGFLADRLHFTVGLINSHDGGLIDDDALAFGVDQGIGRAEVDCEISGEQAKHGAEFHVRAPQLTIEEELHISAV